VVPGHLPFAPFRTRCGEPCYGTGQPAPGKEVRANGSQVQDASCTDDAKARAEDRAGQAPRAVKAQEGAVLGN
jgi:hypothetical protein